MKKKIFKTWMWFATVLAVLVSCDNEDKVAEESSVAMSFVCEDNWQSETRAAIATSIPTFGLSCSVYPSSGSASSAALGNYFFNIQLSNNITTDYLWPGSAYKCSFYGYYPYGSSYVTLNSTTSSTGAPSYSLTVPADISKQVDFCVSEVKDVAGNYQKTVSLPFSHVCSSLSFKVKNAGVDAITLKSIKFYGVKLTGTYSGGAWSTSGSASTSSSNAMEITTNTAIAGGATIDVAGSSNNIIIIPQAIASGTEILDVLVTINGEDKHYYYNIPGALAWEKGVKYSYTINISNDISLETSSIEDWEGSVFNGENDIKIDGWKIMAQQTPVDLGLSVKWAAGNVGAKNPEDYGLYFAWGETTGYTDADVTAGVRAFSEDVYNAGSAASISGNLTLEQDAAHANLGGNWRMPTKAEFQELLDNCDVTWTENYNGTGVAGCIFTSKINGNSVFFPAAGDGGPWGVGNVGSDGDYWSASWDSSSYAGNLYFDSMRQNVLTFGRFGGLSVRGVCE